MFISGNGGRTYYPTPATCKLGDPMYNFFFWWPGASINATSAELELVCVGTAWKKKNPYWLKHHLRKPSTFCLFVLGTPEHQNLPQNTKTYNVCIHILLLIPVTRFQKLAKPAASNLQKKIQLLRQKKYVCTTRAIMTFLLLVPIILKELQLLEVSTELSVTAYTNIYLFSCKDLKPSSSKELQCGLHKIKTIQE